MPSSIHGSDGASMVNDHSAQGRDFNPKTGTIEVNGKTYYVKVRVNGEWEHAKLGKNVPAASVSAAKVDDAIKGLLNNAGIKKEFNNVIFSGEGKYQIDGKTRTVTKKGGDAEVQTQHIQTVYTEFQCTADGQLGHIAPIKKKKKGEEVGEVDENASSKAKSVDGSDDAKDIDEVEDDEDDEDDDVDAAEKSDSDEDVDDVEDDDNVSVDVDNAPDGAIMLEEVEEDDESVIAKPVETSFFDRFKFWKK